ncbi:conserved hypothetical protein [Desulfamplus magnetovallimortis]|uniref:DUF1178 domain-containing protein n=1 Tax=Desulfamplus magnetovallimortis TaxID=1246637 RepID=A0A1W1HGK2_9BACT|nr:DUF1178 family protein [Desulfamplus magnetovallimortis]SLM31641.1 conserved hypothetical protein [Desulfamplus magnetovallimortis]
MIVFDLECVNGHSFEGWFDDSEDFEQQQNQGLLTCPMCETYAVARKLSPVAVKTSSSASFDGNAPQDLMAAIADKITTFVENNFENVGSNFAKEALKIHYGASDARNIRGTTTAEEDAVLKKEGVPVVRIGSRRDNHTDKDDLN